MSSNDIQLGKGRNAASVNLQGFKGGIKREDLKTEEEKSIFDAIDNANGKANGVLDEKEIQNFIAQLRENAGNEKLSKREARKFLEEHGLKDIDPKQLFSFVEGIAQKSENVKSCQIDDDGNVIIKYKDDSQETVHQDKTSEIMTTDENGNVRTQFLDASKNKTKETVVNGKNSDTTEFETDAQGNTVPKKQTVVSEEGAKTSVTEFTEGKKTQTTETTDNGATTTVISYDDKEQPATAVQTQGEYTVKNFTYVEGKARETSRVENKGQDNEKKTEFTYDDTAGTVTENITENGGAKTTTRTKKDGDLLKEEVVEGKKTTTTTKTETGYTQVIQDGDTGVQTQNQLNADGNRLSQVKVADGKQYELTYDGAGNTTGIIVQNGESPQSIAKKFGVPLDKLLEANQDVLQGKKYFDVGTEIKIPREMEADEKVLQGRKDAQGAIADFQRDEAIRAQKRAEAKARAAAENKALKQLGIKNRQGAGKTYVSPKGKKYSQYTVVGQAAFARTIVKDKQGNFHVFAHDGVELKDEYVKVDIAHVQAGHKRTVVNGKAYYVTGERGDKHGRMTVVDWKGNQAVLSGGKSKTDLSDRVILNKGYVEGSDARDAGQAQQTVAGGKNVTYVKDSTGRVWYWDEKTGKALVKGQYSEFVNKEATAISEQIYDAAHDGIGTDSDKLKEGVSHIYSNDLLTRVNSNLAAKDSDYKGDDVTTPLEALILDEETHGNARPYFQTLMDNGAMTTQQKANCVTREIEHELHGGVLGYTSTKGLNEAMNLVPDGDRDTRLAIEAKVKERHPELKADNGSVVRAYIADDGWNAQEVDQFDANWVANNSYKPGVDQEHRNGVIGRLCFDYDSKEALHKGLKACSDDPNSQDYQYLSQRAVEENEKRGYQTQFTNQECVQTYLAGRASDEEGVDVEQLSACNTLLFKGEKPARVQAEESLYAAKQSGDLSGVFSSSEPEVYNEIQNILNTGDVKGVKNLEQAYKTAMKNTTDANDRTRIKGNAMLSGHVQFSQKEVTDFCIELMHSIDNNRGKGGSSGYSGGYTNDADEQMEQLQAILTQHPEIINDLKAQVKAGKFEYNTYLNTGASGSSSVQTMTTDTKQTYLDVLNNTNTIAKDEVFLDANGKKITDPAVIAQLKEANMASLKDLRAYVAQLEREYKMGVDEEGAFSDAANGLVRYSGLGTDRGDVANKYKEAKRLLAQLEAAANGKLRDSKGNVVSAQKLAQGITDKQKALQQTNADYESSIGMAKMVMTLAPVIAVTTVVTGGAGLTSWMAVGGTMITTAAVEGGIQTAELLTSETGNTAENRAAAVEQVAWDTALAGGSVKVGQMAERFAVAGVQSLSAAEKAAIGSKTLNALSKASTAEQKAFFSTASKFSAKLDQVTDKVGASVISKQANLIKKFAPNISDANLQKAAVILARGEAAGAEITSDTVQSLVQMYCQDGQFNAESFTQGMIMSIAGNTIGHMTSGVKEFRASGHDTPAPQPKVLDKATVDGKKMPGGKLGEAKFKQVQQEVADELPNATPERAAQIRQEADQLQAQARWQGRAVKHMVEDEIGFVEIGKERIDFATANADQLAKAKKAVEGWTTGTRNKEAILAKIDERMKTLGADGTPATPKTPERSSEVVGMTNDNVNQTADQILAGKKGALGPHDAATLSDHLTNNLKTADEIEQFISDIKNRVGVDDKGRMHVYQVEGIDHAAEIVKQAQNKLKQVKAHAADLAQVSGTLDNAIAAQKGLSGDDLQVVRAFMSKSNSAEELQGLIDKMSANKNLRNSQAARKLLNDMKEKVEILNAKAASTPVSVPKSETPEVEPQGAHDAVETPVAQEADAQNAADIYAQEAQELGTPAAPKGDADFVAERQRLIDEGKLNPDGSEIKAPKAEVKTPENQTGGGIQPSGHDAATPKAGEVAETPAAVQKADAPAVTPKAEVTPEVVNKQVADIPDSEIPSQHKKLWSECKAQISELTDKLKTSFNGNRAALKADCQKILAGLSTISKTASAKVKAQIAKLADSIKSMYTSAVTPKQRPKVAGTDGRTLPEVNPDELVRNAGNDGKPVNEKYIQTSREARQYLYQSIESGAYTESLDSYIQTINDMHVISAVGKDGTKFWYKDAGQGGLAVNPGVIRGKGQLSNQRVAQAMQVEEVAKKYGDSYRVNQSSKVKLDGISEHFLPRDIAGGGHVYPDGASLKTEYYAQMHRTAKEALELIESGASEKKILAKIAEHYQYAANARPYGQINNSLFMNEINSLLTKAGLNTMPHGQLDIAAMHLQPKTFQKYFIDQYHATGIKPSAVKAADVSSSPKVEAPKAKSASSDDIEMYEDYSEAASGSALPKNQGVVLNGNEALQLGNSCLLDMSAPDIRQKLARMKDGEVITVGREVNGANDIKISDDLNTVSRQHLTIEKWGDKFVVTDMSTNGTKIGEHAVNYSAAPVNQRAVSSVAQQRPELDKYKVNSGKQYGQVDETDFALQLTAKYGYSTGDGAWSSYHTDNPHSAWKMHLFSVDQADYQKMADVILPYLRDHGIEHKCLGFRQSIEVQSETIQRGKAFTIYPKSNAEMEQVARDLDYIIKNNGMGTSQSHIAGDNNLGDSGRLFYRYEYKSKSQMNDVLDVNTESGYDNYDKNYYDANRGEGRYLADDMSVSDDPWANFDPSNPASKPAYQNVEPVSAQPVKQAADDVEIVDWTPASQGKQAAASNEAILIPDYSNAEVGTSLPRGQEVTLSGTETLHLGNEFELDMSAPDIQRKLANMKDGEIITVGRGANGPNDIKIDDRWTGVSRRHLTIEKAGNEFIVKDLSTNGTKIGEEQSALVYAESFPAVGSSKAEKSKSEKFSDAVNEFYSDPNNVEDLHNVAEDVVDVINDPHNVENWENLASDAVDLGNDVMGLDSMNPMHGMDDLDPYNMNMSGIDDGMMFDSSASTTGTASTAGKRQAYNYTKKFDDGSVMVISSPTKLSHAELQNRVNQRIADITASNNKRIDGVQNRQLKSIIANDNLNPLVKSRLIDLDETLSLINDPKVKNFVEQKLAAFTYDGNYSMKDLTELEMAVDAINQYNGNYTSIVKNRGIDVETRSGSDLRKFAGYLDGKGTSVDEILTSDAAIPEQFRGSKNQATIKADLSDEGKLEGIREFLKNYPDSQMSDHFYGMYLESTKGAPEVYNKLTEFTKRYGSKVFLPSTFDGKQFTQSMDFLAKELDQWRIASHGEAKFPPVIDFSSAKAAWYDSGSAYGKSAANAYSEAGNTGAVSFSSMDTRSIAQSLRHEMTHSNDLKHGNIPAKYDFDQIRGSKQFADEFRRAGIPEDRLDYAYTNPQEFIARASEGDMSQYSPEFKQVLVDFGMPEWMFNMKGEAPVQTVSRLRGSSTGNVAQRSSVDSTTPAKTQAKTTQNLSDDGIAADSAYDSAPASYLSADDSARLQKFGKNHNYPQETMSTIEEALNSISEQMKNGAVPSKEMLATLAKDLSAKYNVNATQLRSRVRLAMKNMYGWINIEQCFDMTEDKAVRLCGRQIDKFKETKGLTDSPAGTTSKVETDVQQSPVAQTSSVKNTVTDEDAAVISSRSRNPEATTEALNILADKIKNGEIPSKEMLDSVSKELSSKYGVSSLSLSNDIQRTMMKMRDWNGILDNFESSQAINSRSNRAMQATTKFRESRSLLPDDELNARAAAKTAQEAKAQAAHEAEVKSAQERQAILDKAADKYPDVVNNKNFRDDNDQVRLISLMDNYDLQMNTRNFDETQIYQRISAAGITNDADVDIAFGIIKKHFHSDVIAHETRVKEMKQKYAFTDNKSVDNADTVIANLKAKHNSGAVLTESDIDGFIRGLQDYDVRDVNKMKNMIMNDPELRPILNQDMRLDIYENPKFEYANRKEISDAITMFDGLKSEAKKGKPLSMDTVNQYMDTVYAKNGGKMSSTSLSVLKGLISEDNTLADLCKDFIGQLPD